MISRRQALAASAAVLAAPMARAADSFASLADALERRHGGRLGVAILDPARGDAIAHRGDELFPMCSTFKLIAAAFVLARVDRGEENLTRRVAVRASDIVPYAPKVEPHVGGDLAMADLCEAAVVVSDNAAGNLLLESFGGPQGLTAFARSMGDSVTRLDRREPELNEAAPGDPRDTTSPLAMARLAQRLVVADALSAASRGRLAEWMEACATGLDLLRSGAPTGWRVGDKTGSGENNVRNDVAVFWPPGRAPIVVAAYYAGSRASKAEQAAVFAEIGRFARG